MEKQSELDALRAATKFEADGRKFLLGASKKTEQRYGQPMFQSIADAELEHIERKFYQQLACEERGHFLIFQDMHEYYMDPVHWYSQREKLHWDGA